MMELQLRLPGEWPRGEIAGWLLDTAREHYGPSHEAAAQAADSARATLCEAMAADSEGRRSQPWWTSIATARRNLAQRIKRFLAARRDRGASRATRRAGAGVGPQRRTGHQRQKQASLMNRS